MREFLARVTKTLTARLLGAIGSLLALLLSAFIVQNYENWVADRGIADVVDAGPPPGAWKAVMDVTAWLATHALPVAAYIAGPFGIGFAVAAVLFSPPDIPVLSSWWRGRAARRAAWKPTRAEDMRLAEACEA